MDMVQKYMCILNEEISSSIYDLLPKKKRKMKISSSMKLVCIFINSGEIMIIIGSTNVP